MHTKSPVARWMTRWPKHCSLAMARELMAIQQGAEKTREHLAVSVVAVHTALAAGSQGGCFGRFDDSLGDRADGNAAHSARHAAIKNQSKRESSCYV